MAKKHKPISASQKQTLIKLESKMLRAIEKTPYNGDFTKSRAFVSASRLRDKILGIK